MQLARQSAPRRRTHSGWAESSRRSSALALSRTSGASSSLQPLGSRGANRVRTFGKRAVAPGTSGHSSRRVSGSDRAANDSPQRWQRNDCIRSPAAASGIERRAPPPRPGATFAVQGRTRRLFASLPCWCFRRPAKVIDAGSGIAGRIDANRDRSTVTLDRSRDSLQSARGRARSRAHSTRHRAAPRPRRGRLGDLGVGPAARCKHCGTRRIPGRERREIGQARVEEVRRRLARRRRLRGRALRGLRLLAQPACSALDWLGAGEFAAGRVLAGEWWRTVTALTVHVDCDHVAGNSAFGAFFGYFVGRYLGRGVGWLADRRGRGALANALDALVQAPRSPFDRRVDRRIRGARSADGVHVAARLPARDAVARADRADRRRARLARVHGRGGREHRSRRASLRGSSWGSRRGLLLARGCAIDRCCAPRGCRTPCAAAALTVVVGGAWIWGSLGWRG